MLEKELRYFQTHQDELVEQYEGKYIVIKNQKVIGVYETTLAAYLETKKEHEEGTFSIQHCIPGEEAYTQHFHTRVSFA